MTKRLSSSRTFIFLAVPELPKTATGKVQKYVLRGKQPSSVRLTPITFHRAIAGAFPLSSIVVSELPKTATGKVQKYVLRGKQPAISKQ